MQNKTSLISTQTGQFLLSVFSRSKQDCQVSKKGPTPSDVVISIAKNGSASETCSSNPHCGVSAYAQEGEDDDDDGEDMEGEEGHEEDMFFGSDAVHVLRVAGAQQRALMRAQVEEELEEDGMMMPTQAGHPMLMGLAPNPYGTLSVVA